MGCGIDGEYCREEELEKELKVLEGRLKVSHGYLDEIGRVLAEGKAKSALYPSRSAEIQSLAISDVLALLPPKGAGDE